MKELFSRMDKDNSGSLERPEVILFMKALSDDLSDEHIAMIFDNLDTDGSNTIDLDEFMVWKNKNPNLMTMSNICQGPFQSNLCSGMEACE